MRYLSLDGCSTVKNLTGESSHEHHIFGTPGTSECDTEWPQGMPEDIRVMVFDDIGEEI